MERRDNMLWLAFKSVVSVFLGYLVYLLTYKFLGSFTKSESSSFLMSLMVSLFFTYFIFKSLLAISIFSIIFGAVAIYLFGGFILALLVAYLLNKAGG